MNIKTKLEKQTKNITMVALSLPWFYTYVRSRQTATWVLRLKLYKRNN